MESSGSRLDHRLIGRLAISGPLSAPKKSNFKLRHYPGAGSIAERVVPEVPALLRGLRIGPIEQDHPGSGYSPGPPDPRRINEHDDPDHAPRAAEFARTLQRRASNLPDRKFHRLHRAGAGHTHE